jgi:hypothetical protein
LYQDRATVSSINSNLLSDSQFPAVLFLPDFSFSFLLIGHSKEFAGREEEKEKSGKKEQKQTFV